MTTEEQKLIAAFRAGDTAAFDILYQRYGGRAFAFARRLTGSAPDAEDLTQDAFVAAYEGAAKFRANSSFLSWLLAIVVRRWRDGGRRPRISTVSSEICDVESISARRAPDGFTDDQLDAAAIRTAIVGLEPKLSEAFLLVVVQGLTHREAAAILEKPVGTVKWRVAAAAERIRAALRQGAQEEEETENVDVLAIHS